CIYLVIGTIGKKERAGLRFQGQDVARAVVFVVAARAFVFADRARVIFINCAAGDDANLFLFAHQQTIEIDARRLFLFERTLFNQLLKIFGGLAIDRIAVDV